MNARQLQSILSYRLGLAKWLFIHIPKNAGVSFAKAPALRWRMIRPAPWTFAEPGYAKALLRAMQAEGAHHGFAHARLRDVDPKISAKLRPVAVIRNPWSRVVSRYRFAVMAYEQASNWQQSAPPSFEAFLEERHRDGGKPFFWHRAVRGWYPQRDYIVDGQDKIAVDTLRLEHLDAEVPAYFGLTEPIRPRNVTRRAGGKSPWQELYTPKTIQIVADWYAEDIAEFGFDFDTSAQRNHWSAAS